MTAPRMARSSQPPAPTRIFARSLLLRVHVPPPPGARANLVWRYSNCDGDLSPYVSGFEVAHGVGYLGQRVGPVDDRGDLAGFDEPAHCFDVGVVFLRGQHGQSLAHEHRERLRTELSTEASGPLAALFATHDDERSLGSEYPTEARERAVPTDVEDQVVA